MTVVQAVMDRVETLIEQAQAWYARSPKAQQVYSRVSDDVSVVAERARPAVHQIWERVGPLIDPPTESGRDQPKTPGSTSTTS